MTVERPKHIFIVDDNEVYSMLLDYTLSKDSIYQFVSFKTGEECLKNLYMNPDIIILDYGLPGMDGYQTLLEIKKQKPQIHVVILTANKDRKIATQLLKAGADYIVLKEGHGEKQIIKKIEAIFSKEARKEKYKGTLFGKLLYSFIALMLIALTVFYIRNKG